MHLLRTGCATVMTRWQLLLLLSLLRYLPSSSIFASFIHVNASASVPKLPVSNLTATVRGVASITQLPHLVFWQIDINILILTLVLRVIKRQNRTPF